MVFKSLIFVFLGGGLGSILRYVLSFAINRQFDTSFPWATLCVNLMGCFFIGLFYSLSSGFHFNEEWKLFLTVGLCGGFTTFSTFSNEGLYLLKMGCYSTYLVYLICSVVAGLLAVLLGAWLAK